MSTLKKLSEGTKMEARKKGKLPKAPKKPKRSASAMVLENYVTKYNAYVDKVHAMAASEKKRTSLAKQIFG